MARVAPQDYEGPWHHQSSGQHLANFGRQLEAVGELGSVVAHVNCHSGCDGMDEDTMFAFLSGAHALAVPFLEAMPHIGAGTRGAGAGAAGALCGLSHETHRSRIFFHQAVSRRITSRLPATRLTLDASHDGNM